MQTIAQPIKRAKRDLLVTRKTPANLHIENMKLAIEVGDKIKVWQDDVLVKGKVLGKYKHGVLCKVGNHREFFTYFDVRKEVE